MAGPDRQEHRGDADEVGTGEEQSPQPTLPHVDASPQARRDAPPPELAAEAVLGSDVYTVQLGSFDGPLDLLLHLIRKHELDILDIPISFITEKYLEYLDMMKDLSIDVASEYLVMAATLAHIKSKMLLPPDPSAAGDEDGDDDFGDPRMELVRRLLEYQKYRDAAEQLAGRSRLDRDMFQRGTSEPVAEGPVPLASINVFKLFDAFSKVLERADQHADHQVMFERVSIAERVVQLTELLHDRRRATFDELFALDGGATPTRSDLVVTFLAVLEMCKMRVIRVVQDGPLGSISVEFAPKRIAGDAEPAPPPPPRPLPRPLPQPLPQADATRETAEETHEQDSGSGIS